MTRKEHEAIVLRLRTIRAQVKAGAGLIEAIYAEPVSERLVQGVRAALTTVIPSGVVDTAARTVENYLAMLDGNRANLNTWLGRAISSQRGFAQRKR